MRNCRSWWSGDAFLLLSSPLSAASCNNWQGMFSLGCEIDVQRRARSGARRWWWETKSGWRCRGVNRDYRPQHTASDACMVGKKRFTTRCTHFPWHLVTCVIALQHQFGWKGLIARLACTHKTILRFSINQRLFVVCFAFAGMASGILRVSLIALDTKRVATCN